MFQAVYPEGVHVPEVNVEIWFIFALWLTVWHVGCTALRLANRLPLRTCLYSTERAAHWLLRHTRRACSIKFQVFKFSGSRNGYKRVPFESPQQLRCGYINSRMNYIDHTILCTWLACAACAACAACRWPSIHRRSQRNRGGLGQDPVLESTTTTAVPTAPTLIHSSASASAFRTPFHHGFQGTSSHARHRRAEDPQAQHPNQARP